MHILPRAGGTGRGGAKCTEYVSKPSVAKWSAQVRRVELSVLRTAKAHCSVKGAVEDGIGRRSRR